MTDTARPARIVDLGELVFAALGIFLLLGLVPVLESMVWAAATYDRAAELNRLTLRYSTIDAALRLAVGSGLILARRPLSRRLTSDALIRGLLRHDMLAVALAAIGVWLFVAGTSETLQQLVSGHPGTLGNVPLLKTTWPWPAGSAVKLMLGAVLFLGAHTVARLWQRLRQAG